MIFSDEKHLWDSELEELSTSLANKNMEEIYEILDRQRFVSVGAKSKDNIFQRFCKVSLLLIYPLLFLLSGIKWLLTGDQYLDSWFRKIGIPSEIINRYLY